MNHILKKVSPKEASSCTFSIKYNVSILIHSSEEKKFNAIFIKFESDKLSWKVKSNADVKTLLLH